MSSCKNDKLQNWMIHLSDDVYLCDITIPGTHNACAFNCNIFAKNQHLDLRTQLRMGVRFFDIRCRHTNDTFTLHHGSANLGLDFRRHVLDTFVDYLSTHGSETIVLLVSSEYQPRNNSSAFHQTFIEYAHADKERWYLSDDMPKLAEARGKMVLLRRFYSPVLPLGIDMSGWRDSQTFELANHVHFTFVIQDEYRRGYSQKWSRFVAFMENASHSSATGPVYNAHEQIDTVSAICNTNGHATTTKTTTTTNTEDQNTGHGNGLINSEHKHGAKQVKKWFINYASAMNWPTQPPALIARQMNKRLTSHLLNNKDPKMTKYRGVILLDFATHDLVEAIFRLNFTNLC